MAETAFAEFGTPSTYPANPRAARRRNSADVFCRVLLVSGIRIGVCWKSQQMLFRGVLWLCHFVPFCATNFGLNVARRRAVLPQNHVTPNSQPHAMSGV
jgi:hypothetical protein